MPNKEEPGTFHALRDDDDGSSSHAPSDASDFYTVAPPDVQPGDTNTAMPDRDDPEDEDSSSSEMDVSASSRAPSPEPQTQVGFKRKLDDSSLPLRASSSAAELDATKKQRTAMLPKMNDSHKYPLKLPQELWQQVFLHLPPAMLCRCLRVCRTFNDYLTNTRAPPVAKKSQPKVRVLDSEAIWTNARKTFFANLPKPLPRCSELQMLQLVGGRTCQFCEREPLPSPATTPFNCGPGSDGLRVIWPFGIRACGRCIENNTLKDVQILVSSASALRFGLPYIFLTPDLHFVPEIQRQQPGGIPSHLRVSKVYYTKDIERIVTELDEAKTLGDGAADEWRKGLRDKGQEEMTEAARWERWEASMQLGRDLTQALREYDLSSFPNHVAQRQSRSAGGFSNGTMPPSTFAGNVPSAVAQPMQPIENGSGQQSVVPSPQYQQPPRQVRDPHEVLAARHARKVDIERRCLEFEPPLGPEVLSHIDSYNAAMMIAGPMTDEHWENFLKPRILAQRETGEMLYHQKQERWAALQAAAPPSQTDIEYAKTGREMYDKEYEHAQEPLRKKLGEYADECIDGKWKGAHHLDRDNTPSFAVEVMLHVFQRYAKDKQASKLPSAVPPVRRGSNEGTPVPEAFLSLDNMKWVFDNKIRPLTDGHRRELFVCAGCPEERRPKWFAFEGLLQHYGAKHTTAFSKGNIVVQWQTAEWPEEAPFHQNPSQFTKADKRPERGLHRPRHTPQSHHDGPWAPPGSSRLLSDNPFFAGHGPLSAQGVHGYPQPVPGFGPYQFGGQGSPHVTPLGRNHAVPNYIPAEPSIDMSEQAQVNKLSNDAREIWDALDGVKELLECVRIQAAVHHVVMRFQDRFHQPPSLDLLTDALATNAQIRPVKNASGLACQICVAGQTDGSANYQSYYARIRNVKLYNASSLITHFKVVHQRREGVPLPDWTQHMIELPEQQLISDLMYAPGMDDDKLAIIAAAFPGVFPPRLPKIGLVQEAPPEVGPDSGLANRLLDRLNKKPKQQPKKKGQHGTNGNATPGREGSHEPFPEPSEDEYDPRRPMYLGMEEKTADPARFDTDLARKPPAGGSPWGSNTLNLPPETLATLKNLSGLALHQQQQAQEDERGDRSPSVGRSEPMDTKHRPSEGSPQGQQPNISAILASLAPHLQSAAPPGTPSRTAHTRSDSAPNYAPLDPYGQPYGVPPPTSYQDDQRPATRHAAAQPPYRSSVEHSPRYDETQQSMHLAAARNTQSFQQNQNQHRPPPTQHSPPRYRYVYDQQQHAPPPPTSPIYRDQPIQYFQLPPEHDRAAGGQGYEYDRSSRSHAAPPPPHSLPPKPVYVDEYGRQLELIPIDSAPAPVQYLPHPFEQQQQQYYAQQQQGSPPSGMEGRPALAGYYGYAAQGPPSSGPGQGQGQGYQGMY